jgi:hypothetical protein
MPLTKCGKFYYYGRKSRVKMMDELNQRYDVDVDHVRLNLKQYWKKQNDCNNSLYTNYRCNNSR